MYKLMVVDDEYNIRDGISNAIPWVDHNIEVVAQASSAIEAIQKFGQFHPDIVITDIVMDDMNGLELIEHLYSKNYNVKIIIISGYDDFQYAKRAIELGVYSYVLKPVIAEELLAIADSLVRELEKNKRIEQKVLALEEELEKGKSFALGKFLADLIKGRITDQRELDQRSSFLDIQFDCSKYQCLIFTIDDYSDLVASSSAKEIQMIILGIKQIVAEIMSDDCITMLLENNQTDIVAIIGDKFNNAYELVSQLYKDIDLIRNNIRDLFGITVTVGIGRQYGNILNIRRSFLEASKAIEYKMIVGKDAIINIDDVVSMGGSRYVYPKDKEKRILNSLTDNDADKIEMNIDNFFIDLQNQNCFKNQVKMAVLQLLLAISGKLLDMGLNVYQTNCRQTDMYYEVIEKLETIEDIKLWVIEETTKAVNNIHLKRINHTKEIISKANKYMLENFSEYEISLESVAEHVYLSPSYFSKLYKEETGESYIEFLTKIRMNKAQQYLKQTNMQVADIGIAVGYLNSQYFSTVFKKNVGVTPLEYRIM